MQTAEEFREQYMNQLGGSSDNEPGAALAYDAVWALALALNRYNTYLMFYVNYYVCNILGNAESCDFISL